MSPSRILMVGYYLAAAVFYAGWLFHGSEEPLLFRYSGRYLVLLVLMSVVFAAPLLFRRAVAVLGLRQLVFALTPLAVLAVTSYFVVSTYMAYTERHLFDPFLQNPLPRLDDHQQQAEPGVYRILAMGGSTTACLWLEQDKRYPFLVETLLNERQTVARVEVINAGQPWYSTKHTLISYTTYAEAWEPDLILVMHGINDLLRSFSPPACAVGEYNDQWTHFYGPSIRGAVPVPPLKRLVQKNLKLPMEAWYSDFRPVIEEDFPLKRYYSLPVFEQNLDRMARFFRASAAEVFEEEWFDDSAIAKAGRRADLAFVTQPTFYKPEMTRDEREKLWMHSTYCVVRQDFWGKTIASPASMCQAMAAYNDTVRRVADRRGALLVDAEPHVERNLANFNDDCHTTDAGARALAEQVASAILASGVIESRMAERRPER